VAATDAVVRGKRDAPEGFQWRLLLEGELDATSTGCCDAGRPAWLRLVLPTLRRLHRAPDPPSLTGCTAFRRPIPWCGPSRSSTCGAVEAPHEADARAGSVDEELLGPIGSRGRPRERGPASKWIASLPWRRQRRSRASTLSVQDRGRRQGMLSLWLFFDLVLQLYCI
jgi:hypothetical protein